MCAEASTVLRAVAADFFFNCWYLERLVDRVRVRATLQLTVSQSVCLGVEPNLGLLTRDLFFFF
jgi:hypothetical protein